MDIALRNAERTRAIDGDQTPVISSRLRSGALTMSDIQLAAYCGWWEVRSRFIEPNGYVCCKCDEVAITGGPIDKPTLCGPCLPFERWVKDLAGHWGDVVLVGATLEAIRPGVIEYANVVEANSFRGQFAFDYGKRSHVEAENDDFWEDQIKAEQYERLSVLRAIEAWIECPCEDHQRDVRVESSRSVIYRMEPLNDCWLEWCWALLQQKQERWDFEQRKMVPDSTARTTMERHLLQKVLGDLYRA